MSKITIEFDSVEAVKLISVCNAAIITEEETLRCCSKSLEFKENTKRSIEKIWEIKGKIKKAINDAYGNIVKTENKNHTVTWKEATNCGHPSMAEGYPCPPGTKILAINHNTGEFKITRFDPDNMSRDWDVAFKETDIMLDQPALMLNNLLAQLGWFKDEVIIYD